MGKSSKVDMHIRIRRYAYFSPKICIYSAGNSHIFSGKYAYLFLSCINLCFKGLKV